jgi:hypothetical protein
VIAFFGLVRAVPYETNLEYYALHNDIINGDFSIDADLNEKADNWAVYPGVADLNNGVQKVYGALSGYTYTIIQQTLATPSIIGHIYYVKGSMTSNGTGAMTRMIQFWGGTGSKVLYNAYTDPNDFSYRFTADKAYQNFETHLFCGYNTSYYSTLTDVILIDLTNSFGAGNEPSLSDFETYYLPDEWFQDYESYVPVISEYYEGTDLANDDTAIDWTKALISKNGTNIDLDFYMYLDYDGDMSSINYEAYTIPLHYYDNTYNIGWIQDDYDIHLFKADFSDPELYAIYKEILFDRRFNEENYIAFPVVSYDGFTVQPRYWLDIKSSFIYNVNIGSVIVSVSQINYNDTNPINSAFVAFFDQDENYISPSLELPSPGDVFNSRIFDEFQSKYNNIRGFKLSFDLLAYDYSATYPWYYHCVHEIGVFSVSSVLLFDPSSIDYGDDEISIDDLDDMFPQTVVEWYDIGGHIQNLINTIGKSLYENLPVQEMIDTVTTWTDYIGTLASMVPPTWWAIIGGVVGICFLGLGYSLVERWF